MDTQLPLAHTIHIQAEEAREKDDHTKALCLFEEAIVAYQKEDDCRGIVEALLGRFLTYKHLFLLSKDKVFLHVGKGQIDTAFNLANEYKFEDKLSTIHFHFGEVYMLLEDFPASIEHYSNSLELFKGPLAQKGDITYHLGEAFYLNDDKKNGEEKLLEGLDLIQKNASEVDPFIAHVWESGCYLRLADLLYEDKPVESKMHMEKAREIIDADEKLIIRKRQYQELMNSLRQRQMKRFNEDSLL